MMRLSKKDPATMTPGEINRELDGLDRRASKLSRRMIDEGRGGDTPKDIAVKARHGDIMAKNYIAVTDRQADLRIEIEIRYGPGAPSRLPRGYKKRAGGR